MGEPITYVGIDAHARELHLAMLLGGRRGRDRCGPVPMKHVRSSGCDGDSNAMRPGRSNAAMKRARPAIPCSGG